MSKVDAASPPEPDHGQLPIVLGAVDLDPAEPLFTQLNDELPLPDEQAPPGRRRHIVRYAALVAAAGVVATAVVVGPTLWHVYGARHTTLTLPPDIAGLSRDTGSGSQDTADYLRDAVHTGTSLARPLGAVYDVAGDQTHSVLLFGGSGAVYRPEHTLGTVLGLLDDSSGGITGLHTVAAGPLGGTMKCGTSMGASDDPTDADIPICGWADYGSVAAALFPGRTADQAAELMRQFRAAIEHR